MQNSKALMKIVSQPATNPTHLGLGAGGCFLAMNLLSIKIPFVDFVFPIIPGIQGQIIYRLAAPKVGINAVSVCHMEQIFRNTKPHRIIC